LGRVRNGGLTAKHDLSGASERLRHAVDRAAARAGTQCIQFEVRGSVLYPSNDERRVLIARLVDLENIHRDAVRQFLSGNRTLDGGQGTMTCAGELIRCDAAVSVGLND
jgi:hypothetical protein